MLCSAYSEALSVLAYMMLILVMSECVTLVSKTMQNKLKESPMMSPRTRVEPAKKFCLTEFSDRWQWASMFRVSDAVDVMLWGVVANW